MICFILAFNIFTDGQFLCAKSSKTIWERKTKHLLWLNFLMNLQMTKLRTKLKTSSFYQKNIKISVFMIFQGLHGPSWLFPGLIWPLLQPPWPYSFENAKNLDHLGKSRFFFEMSGPTVSAYLSSQLADWCTFNYYFINFSVWPILFM